MADLKPGDWSDKHVMTFGGVQYWVDMQLVSIYEKPNPPRLEWVNVSTLRRLPSGIDGDPEECQQVGDCQSWTQLIGHYWVLPFALAKRRSAWFWVGVGAAIAGSVLLVVATAGVAGVIGTAATATTAGTFVTAAGAATATTTILIASGGALLGGGGAAASCNKEKDVDCPGASAGPGFYYDDPIWPAEELMMTNRGFVKNAWHPCAHGE